MPVARAVRYMQFGVDEAGKGPVVGPMVAACVAAVDGASAAALPSGVADSKTLAPARREALHAAIRGDDRFVVGVARVTTDRIDDPTTDMNSLTVAAHVGAVLDVFGDDAVGEDAVGDRVGAGDGVVGVCDAGDVDADRFADRVTTGLRDAPDAPAVGATVHAEHRADESDPLVAAASVVAKVERDAAVDAIRDRYAEYGDVGSGYPSDPATRSFLATYVDRTGGLPDCARRSWQTCDDVLAAAEQSSLDAF